MSEILIDEVEYYGEKELRWYQVATRNAVAEALENGSNRVLCILPTGAGKTLTVAASMSFPRLKKALGVVDRPVRVLFAAHTHRLLTQAESTFVEENDVDLIPQSIFSDIPDSVIKKGWDVTILDESHHESCMSFQYHLEKMGEKPIIGLTATPDRADGCVIKFDHVIEPLTREQAVEEGWLAETDLLSFVDTPSKSKTPILTDILSNFHMEMDRAMIFVRTKVEVAAINRVMLSLGRKSVGLLGQKDKEVNVILDQFSEGKIDTIVNCKKINEGVDVRGCTDVVLGRQFGSYPQLNQVIGRASRPDSDCRVWELINPLSGRNLDTTVVVGTPRSHRLYSKRRGNWEKREFDYTARYVDDMSVAA